MRRIFYFIAALILCLEVTACTHNISPDTYAVGSVGQVNRAAKGVIVSARQVDISGSQSGVGGAAGAAGGAVAGSAIGGGIERKYTGSNWWGCCWRHCRQCNRRRIIKTKRHGIRS